MLHKLKGIAMVPVFAIALTSGANALEISPQYLDGVWTLDSADNCGLKEFEHVTFRADGTVQGKRFDVVDSIGFWRNTGDQLVVHLLTSPAHFDERLKHYQGFFDYFPVRVLAFDIQPESFEAVGTIGDQMKKVTLFRCKN